MSVAVYIAHAAWAPARLPALDRLMADVPGATVIRSERQEHAGVWARRLWRHGAASAVTHPVFLNDDVRTCPDFEAACEAMTEACPDQVIALHTTAPQAVTAPGPWLASYWLTGPGYIIPRKDLPDLLKFVSEWPDLVASTNEDNVVMQWAWHRQRPIWHAVPALVQHDVSVPSTLGYDHHPMRRSVVPWQSRPLARLTDPDYWRVKGQPPWIECPWMPLGQLMAIEARHGKPCMCAFCGKVQADIESTITGNGICGTCINRCISHVQNDPYGKRA